jgi:hypothetical protein
LSVAAFFDRLIGGVEEIAALAEADADALATGTAPLDVADALTATTFGATGGVEACATAESLATGAGFDFEKK